MNKTMAIIKREFMTRVLTKGFLIGTLLGPVLIIGMMFLPSYFMMQEPQKSTHVGVLNMPENILQQTRLLLNDTLKNGQIKYQIVPIDQSTISRDSIKTSLARFINEKVFDVILEFQDDVIANPSVAFYSKNVSNFDQIRTFRNSLNQIINEERYKQAGIDVEALQKVRTSLKFETVKVTEKGTSKKDAGIQYIATLTMVMMIYFSLVFYGQYIWKGVIEDKVSRVIEVLLSSVNSFQFMMGKILGNGFIGLFQYLIWAGLGILALIYGVAAMPQLADNIPFSPEIFIYFVLYFILGFFFYATFFAIVGAVSSTSDDAQQLQMPITFLIVGALMLSFKAMKDPSGSSTVILSHIPFFSPTMMFTRILASQPPFWEIMVSLLILIFSILLMTFVAGRIFRVAILMYGKRANLPEIVKWIFK